MFVCVCVCVCSQHEEKEKALKEQLSHLTALLPTLQVEWSKNLIINHNNQQEKKNKKKHRCWQILPIIPSRKYTDTFTEAKHLYSECLFSKSAKVLPTEMYLKRLCGTSGLYWKLVVSLYQRNPVLATVTLSGWRRATWERAQSHNR